MADISLFSPITALSGVGQVRAKQLAKLGLHNLYDLISFFPRAYEDRTRLTRICDMEVGVPACFRATVISYPRTAHIRKGMDITKLMVSDMTERLQLVFFNQPYIQDQLKYGEDYIFYGTVKEDRGRHLQNPVFEPATAAGLSTGRILPVYPLTAGISNKNMLRYIRQALEVCLDSLPDILPKSVREKYDLPDAAEAYRTVHQPDSFANLERAKRRLIFEEFFVFSAGLAIMRSRRTQQKTEGWNNLDLHSFLAQLPYTLTGAQTRAIGDIINDLASGTPMSRLVQGDVGSGKTAVAAAAAYLAFRQGRQSAMMAPTEILAEQHFRSLSQLLSPLGMEVVLLTGTMSAAEKKWVKERISNGQTKLVVGTHALLTKDVSFHNLDLVITDEQHRFGVGQRATLAEKAQYPHLLFLSATPIPRTLSLILYGDLDISIMDELPPGRKPVETYLLGENMRERIEKFTRKQVQAGNQVYVVCPAVEENEETTLKSAEVWSRHLQETVFPDLQIGLLHGRMKPSEKDAVMRSFAAKEIHILVATTVIEVGVDVPNSTLMIIEDADRFGLSQLHQLRGRVGRGSAQSYCVLFTKNKGADAQNRLKALCSTNDGFKIAEYDLSQRGPGDFFGSRQHGLPQFKVADLVTDLKTLQQAQDAVKTLSAASLEKDPAYAPLLERLHELFRNNEIIWN